MNKQTEQDLLELHAKHEVIREIQFFQQKINRLSNLKWLDNDKLMQLKDFEEKQNELYQKLDSYL